MEKQIKMVLSPFNPNIEVVGDLVISLHVPYSDRDVTIQINPAITEYKENDDKKDIRVRQVMISESTEETKTLNFCLDNNTNTQKIMVNEREYEINPLSIGKETLDGQDFPSFEFYIKW